MSQQNLVCNLEVLPASLPTEATAGCSLLLLVALETQDNQPVPWEDLAQSVTLSLTLPPAAGDAAADAAAAGTSRGGKGSKGGRGGSKKAEVLLLAPEVLFEGADQELEGLTPAAAEAAAAAAAHGCVVCFRTLELAMAGCYTLKAEYRELRPQLLPALSKEVRGGCWGPVALVTREHAVTCRLMPALTRNPASLFLLWPPSPICSP